LKLIESELHAGAIPGQCGKIEQVDLKPAYVEAVCQFADLGIIGRANFKFAIDSMYGSDGACWRRSLTRMASSTWPSGRK
jgi:phosphoglucomutase